MGLKDVQKKVEESKKIQGNFNSQEIYLVSGDQAVVTILYTGNEEDNNLLDVFFVKKVERLTDSGKTFMKSLYLGSDESEVNSFDKPVKQLGFWVYCYYIDHENKTKEEWVEKKLASGAKKFREEVNDFRMYIGGLGKNQSFYNSINSAFDETGNLSKMLFGISRTGTGKTDTTYAISVLPRESKVPAEKKEEVKNLPSVLEYVKTHLTEDEFAAKSVKNSDKDNESGDLL